MLLLRIGAASADGRSHSARQPAPFEMPRWCGEIPHGAAAARVCVLSGIAENAGRASCGVRRCTAVSSGIGGIRAGRKSRAASNGSAPL